MCQYVPVCTGIYLFVLVCTSTYQHVLVQVSTYSYVQVHTRTYHHELHGAIRDEPGLSERYVPAQESVLDEDLDRDPCEEDEEFFESRPNAEELEQAIGKFHTSTYQYILVCTGMY